MFSNYNPHQNRYTIQFHVVIKTLSPLSHIGETNGNQSNLRTLKLIDLEGNTSECFCLSGNAIRNHILRRRGMDSFLSRINVSVNPTTHQTLFAGGFIDGGTGNDLDLDRKVRTLLVPMSVLGTAKPRDLFG